MLFPLLLPFPCSQYGKEGSLLTCHTFSLPVALSGAFRSSRFQLSSNYFVFPPAHLLQPLPMHWLRPPASDGCAYLSEQKDCASNGTGFRLVTRLLEKKYQKSILNLSSKIFIQKKKEVGLLSTFKRKFRLLLPYIMEK